MDYDRDKRIDLNALHYEWMRQVQLVKDYEEEVVLAKAKVDEAEEAMKVEEAFAAERARDRLSAQGKFTVDMVKDAVTLDQVLRLKREALRQAQLSLGLVRAAAKAIDVKKSALEGCVELYKREYFSTPHEVADYDRWCSRRFSEETATVLRDQANEKAKEITKKIRSK